MKLTTGIFSPTRGATWASKQAAEDLHEKNRSMTLWFALCWP
jgi:hypothetical protein